MYVQGGMATTSGRSRHTPACAWSYPHNRRSACFCETRGSELLLGWSRAAQVKA